MKLLQVDEVIELYREQAKVTEPSSAYISNVDVPGHVQVDSFWSQRDLIKAEKVKFARTHFVQLDVVFSAPPQECGTELLRRQSHSGTYTAILRQVKDEKGEEKQHIEIWNNNSKLQNIDVSKLEQHGKVYEDGEFGCFEWSYEEGHLLYVAEKKDPKTKSYFDPEADTDVVKGVTRGDEFVYKEHWGEQLVGKSHPVVCVLDVESGVVSTMDNLPDDVSPGQAIWCEKDEGIICVGFWHTPYRLGKVYCPIRRSALFHINLKTSSCTVLTGTDMAVHSPRFSPDFSKLVYLENKQGGTHQQCSKLMMIDWATKGIVTVVDIPKYSKGEGFPGLHVGGNLTNRCWSKDNKRLVVSTQWRSKKELVIIHTETGDVTRITNDAEVGGWTVLDVHKDLVLAACSSLTQPPYLVLGQRPPEGLAIKWTKLDPDTPKLPNFSWRVLPMEVPQERVNPKYSNLDYEIILLEPENADLSKTPLVVYPHGGPHSVFSPEYHLYFSLLCQCGFVVLLVNYRGSFGFGDENINSLPGNVGTQDINDVQDAVEKVLGMGIGDREKVVVIGGSHGGFITAHLIGQFPDFYKAAVLRNPALNMAGMTTSSEIPDWCYVEGGVSSVMDFTKLSVGELYEGLWNKSAVRYYDKIKAPVMIMLGANDLRVPPSQGHELRRVLQARGVKVRTLCYPKNSHPINKVDSEADAFINIFQWFSQHI